MLLNVNKNLLCFIFKHNKLGKFGVSVAYKRHFSFHKPKRQNYFRAV